MKEIGSAESAHNYQQDDGVDSIENLFQWLFREESLDALEEPRAFEGYSDEVMAVDDDQDLITRCTDGHDEDEELQPEIDNNIWNTIDGVDWDWINPSLVGFCIANLKLFSLFQSNENDQLEEECPHVTFSKYITVVGLSSSNDVIFQELMDPSEFRGDIRSPCDITPIHSESSLASAPTVSFLQSIFKCYPFVQTEFHTLDSISNSDSSIDSLSREDTPTESEDSGPGINGSEVGFIAPSMLNLFQDSSTTFDPVSSASNVNSLVTIPEFHGQSENIDTSKDSRLLMLAHELAAKVTELMADIQALVEK